MLEADFWQNKSVAQKVIKEKKLYEDLIDSYNNSVKELEELIAINRTRIKVIGCGGGGNNTVTRIREVGIKGVQTVAINTDAQDLLYCNAEKKRGLRDFFIIATRVRLLASRPKKRRQSSCYGLFFLTISPVA